MPSYSDQQHGDYKEALQPITQSSTSQSTKILKELAPQLLHPRILTSPAFLSASNNHYPSIASSTSSTSELLNLANPKNAFIALARLRGGSSLNLINHPSATSSSSSSSASSSLTRYNDGGRRTGTIAFPKSSKQKGPTATDLRIIEDVDRLLSLPIPSSSSSVSSALTSARSKRGGLPTLNEQEEEEEGGGYETAIEGEDEEWGGSVGLLEGFNATIPSARIRKQTRRKRRAVLSEKQLGITVGINELGLKELGEKARGGGGALSLLHVNNNDNNPYIIESIESTPKKRIIKGKRRSSFMPSPLRDVNGNHGTASTSASSTSGTDTNGASQATGKGDSTNSNNLEPLDELLTKPELEVEVKEINQDKLALGVRRRLVLKDLSELEKRIKKLELMKEELGQKLLELKEEELELDDEMEGVQDRLAQLEARQSGRAVSTTSSRRRKGPAFLPSEHDQLPANVAFMTLTSRNPNMSNISSSSSVLPVTVTSLDFSEPYGLLVASYSAPYPQGTAAEARAHGHGQVSVYDLTDGEELARLDGHDGIVKALLVEGDMSITGGDDGRIALWDLNKAIEEGLPEQVSASSASASRSRFVGAAGAHGNRLHEDEEDVFFTSRPSSASGQYKDGRNGVTSSRASHHSDEEGAGDVEFPPLPSPIPVNNTSSSAAGTRSESVASASRMKVLEGHSKAVTCLSYEDTSLVSGSSDKTLRLWDLNTGQCVVTMDILWAISNPLPVEADIEETQSMHNGNNNNNNINMNMERNHLSKSVGNLPTSPATYSHDSDFPWHATSSPSYMTPRTKKNSLSGLRRLSSQAYGLSTLAGSLPGTPSTPTATLANFNFTQATPPFADGSWDMYSDFVGGLQLWSYALASGSADGCVRMWDTRTGQSVRSLIGHTDPITCLQFDNSHLVSGSLDKTVRVWDLRTGRTIETLRYDGPVTSLQFDSRRIMVAGGTNHVQVFNRTTLQQTELMINGHTSPVERLRFMDRYLATGARDSTVKIWSLS